ncbi:DUF6415 family natural product biosynthesis protein [Streptomyces sp. NPDC089795]|uniref:DUF6415 family natural product biosynthesis protein n=1 Tax=Streptomyces sp. NPDC089795 TaxID=3155297 RepID=UPI00342085A9
MTTMTEHVRTTSEASADTEPVGVPGTAPRLKVAEDVVIALALADNALRGPVFRAVRERLRNYITAALPEAEQYARTIPGSTHRRGIVDDTIRHARDLAEKPAVDGDPASRLRVYAKAADHVTRYAEAFRVQRTGRAA